MARNERFVQIMPTPDQVWIAVAHDNGGELHHLPVVAWAIVEYWRGSDGEARPKSGDVDFDSSVVALVKLSGESRLWTTHEINEYDDLKVLEVLRREEIDAQLPRLKAQAARQVRLSELHGDIDDANDELTKLCGERVDVRKRGTVGQIVRDKLGIAVDGPHTAPALLAAVNGSNDPIANAVKAAIHAKVALDDFIQKKVSATTSA
jgi:hypothetical protein